LSLLATVLDFNVGFLSLGENLERKVLYVILDFDIIEFTTNETFGVEDTEGKRK